ncbi:MAG: helix-turn-helix domain-containing protein [Lachnospiraceae bacterium]|nr:helix-turn-helix domain-containing protein [Lachnospiraceae bacterium]
MKIALNEMSLLNYISHYLHTCICRYDSTYSLVSSCCARRDFPVSVLQPEALLKPLITESVSPLPRIVSAQENLIYGIVPFEDDFYLIGPNVLQENVHLNHRLYDLPETELTRVPLYECGLTDYVRILLLLYHLKEEKPEGENDIMQENCLESSMAQNIRKAYTEMTFERNEMAKPHNPYDQEFREQMSIENGNIAGLRESLAEDYIGSIGTLAKDPLRQAKNHAIVLITLASRSAIRGGLSHEIAYSFSDSYIQKIEECRNPVSAMQLARDAEFHYTAMVHELKEQQKGTPVREKNPHIRRCKNYIYSHLHDKLTVRSLAEALDLNANYLSELFKKYEGISLSRYILHEKIERAKNLLMYSEYSYIEIAAYLGFSSQSHLGAQFKNITGCTLRQYRNRYGVWNGN